MFYVLKRTDEASFCSAFSLKSFFGDVTVNKNKNNNKDSLHKQEALLVKFHYYLHQKQKKTLKLSR